MNPKQTRFVHEFLVDRNASAAAARAGYSRKTAGQIGHVLLKNAEVAAAVQAGEAEMATAAKITRQKVLEGLQEAIALAKDRGDANAMIAGYRELGKLCGYYSAERHEVQLNTRLELRQYDMEYMSDAELLEIIAQGDALSTAPPAPGTLN